MKTSTGMYVRPPKPKQTTEQRREAGRKGGFATLHKYGAEHLKQMAIRGGQSLKAKRGREYYAELGRKGRAKQLEKKPVQCPERGGMGHGAAYCENGG